MYYFIDLATPLSWYISQFSFRGFRHNTSYIFIITIIRMKQNLHIAIQLKETPLLWPFYHNLHSVHYVRFLQVL